MSFKKNDYCTLVQQASDAVPGFRKIRHYGMLANRAKAKLKMQQMKMGISIVPKIKMDWKQVAREAMNFDADACPCCLSGRMHTIRFFAAHAQVVETFLLHYNTLLSS
ncbi:MAG: hypothetical protein HOP30_13260 [Cyclobacteriaceae bacterium]|nr:hypothetical protein [Cyclobacteriaceae bacterium]